MMEDFICLKKSLTMGFLKKGTVLTAVEWSLFQSFVTKNVAMSVTVNIVNELGRILKVSGIFNKISLMKTVPDVVIWFVIFSKLSLIACCWDDSNELKKAANLSYNGKTLE